MRVRDVLARRLRRSTGMLPKRSATALRALLTGAALGALAITGLPAAGAAGELGAPGQPRLLESELVVVEGRLEETVRAGARPELVLVGLDGRLYRLAVERSSPLLGSLVGRHITVSGRLRSVPDGPDELRVKSVQLGGP